MYRVAMKLRLLLGLIASAIVACGGDEDPSSSSGDFNRDRDASAEREDGEAAEPFPTPSEVADGSCTQSGDDECSRCADSKCAAEGEACFCAAPNGDTCDDFFDAVLDCNDDPTCEQGARSRFPKGSAASDAYDACLASKCSMCEPNPL